MGTRPKSRVPFHIQDCIPVILLGRHKMESILLAVCDEGLKAAEKAFGQEKEQVCTLLASACEAGKALEEDAAVALMRFKTSMDCPGLLELV